MLLLRGIRLWLFLTSLSFFEVSAQSRIFYIDSYSQGYTHGDQQRDAFRSHFSSDTDIHIRYMESNRRRDPAWLTQLGRQIQKEILDYQPDVIVAADDNANRYVIAPYFKGSQIPVVFSGINISADKYGYPVENVTGVLEAPLHQQVYSVLSSQDKDLLLRGAFLLHYLDEDYSSPALRVGAVQLDYFQARSQQQWETTFLAIQQKYAFIIMGSVSQIRGFDYQRAEQFVLQHSKIPSAAVVFDLRYLAAFSFLQKSAELGDIAAKMVKQILQGKPPAELPVRQNVDAQIFIHPKLIKQTNTQLSFDLIKIARPVHREGSD